MPKTRMIKRRNREKRKVVFIAIICILLLLVLKFFISFGKYAGVALQLATHHKVELKKSNSRVNILLLGTGGGMHDGPNLSDTIIFMSINPDTKKATMISLPRDLYVPELDDKINDAYATGQEKGGKGLLLAKAMIGKILGQQIDYGVRVDFSGFVRAVDMIGGLDITVDNTFDDYAYPIEGKEKETCGHSEEDIATLSAQISSGSATDADLFPCRYEHLHFDKGPAHMDGLTALKYVRSRHALGSEGSDFARSRRQQKVITAFKEKVFSIGTLLNPVKVVNLVDVLKSSIDTDISSDEYDDFIRLAESMKGTKIDSAVIDFGDLAAGRDGLLVNPPVSSDYHGAWVLLPRAGAGDYTEIQQFVKCEITTGNCSVPSSPTP